MLELGSDGRKLVLRATTGWPREYVGQMRFPVDDTFQAGYTLKTRTPVMVSDAAQETRSSSTRWSSSAGLSAA